MEKRDLEKVEDLVKRFIANANSLVNEEILTVDQKTSTIRGWKPKIFHLRSQYLETDDEYKQYTSVLNHYDSLIKSLQ